MFNVLEILLPKYPTIYLICYGIELIIIGLILYYLFRVIGHLVSRRKYVIDVIVIYLRRKKAKKNFIRLGRFFQYLYSKFHLSLTTNSIGWLIALLAAIIATRLMISYGNSTDAVITPETLFALPSKGVDFNLAVIKPLYLLLDGKIFYYYTANYGPSFTLFTIPFIRLVQQLGLCQVTDQVECSRVLYRWLIAATLGGYVIYIWRITKGNREARNTLYLFFAIFMMGTVGSFGLERGNIDIILSLMFGIVILVMRQLFLDKRSSLLRDIALGICAAFLASSKLLFLPFAFFVVATSRRIVISGLVVLISMFIIAHLPNMWGAPSTVLDQIKIAMVFEKEIPFASHSNILYNHSFAAIGSMFTDCFQEQTCIHPKDVRIIRMISFVFAVILFIVPILPTVMRAIRLFRRSYNHKRIVAYIQRIIGILVFYRYDWNVALLELSYFVAAINLIPTFSFDYRLYLSLPVLFFLYEESKPSSLARYYCLLAMLFLGVKSLWIGYYIYPAGMNIFEARGMHIFVVFHYFALIKSAYLLSPAKFRRLLI